MKKKLLRFAALMIAMAFVFTGTACRGGDVVVDIGHDTPAPTAKPTTSPTAEPTPEPTAEPTPEPTPEVLDELPDDPGDDGYGFADGAAATPAP